MRRKHDFSILIVGHVQVYQTEWFHWPEYSLPLNRSFHCYPNIPYHLNFLCADKQDELIAISPAGFQGGDSWPGHSRRVVGC